MTDRDQMELDIQACIDCGLMKKVGDDEFSMTEAGTDYVESVLGAGITDRMQAYALGRLQGLREPQQ
ncbi:MAG: hypothetical protein ACR2OV_00120 [Hyphomicrobiaceae bacterium]